MQASLNVIKNERLNVSLVAGGRWSRGGYWAMTPVIESVYLIQIFELSKLLLANFVTLCIYRWIVV